MRRPSGDDGNALVEFTYLAVLMMVPLVYVLVTVSPGTSPGLPRG